MDSGKNNEVKSIEVKNNKRDYTNASESVKKFYSIQHYNLTYDYVSDRHKWYKKLSKNEYTIEELLKLSDDIVDPSDPDIGESQIHHAFQTAELLRKELEQMNTDTKLDLDWLPLIGLIHDLGKVAVKTHNIEWFESAGDSFPVGCAFSDKVILNYGFEENPDFKNPKFNTRLGIYEPNCGFDSCLFWGHDEIMYQSLLNSNTKLPKEALYVVRYHSFYAWHNQNGYDYLASEKDLKYKKYLNIFQKGDLYSKTDSSSNLFDISYLKQPYYQSLIKKYLPNKIIF